ncbi:Uncharacterized protein dnm_053110 [Desulfonema magnum]|uniref:Uncharacterized protein n=1 Tax=Desulfonema magnum TaxID=45655 RepID=A0A975GPQ7_9BACT|nr:Uncharacterized protein dnm_053110 [Desulfonema magnum]
MVNPVPDGKNVEIEFQSPPFPGLWSTFWCCGWNRNWVSIPSISGSLVNR